MKDIARQCNVSIGTIDRVLHNRGEVAAETREKVIRLVDELGFQPNAFASALALNRSFYFATLMPTPLSHDEYWNKPQLGIRKRTEELIHYRIKMKSFNFNQFHPSDFQKQADHMLETNPDGVILSPFFYKESLQVVSQLREKKIPFVFIDSDLPDQGQLAYVGQDSYQCGRLSARLLSDIVRPSGALLVIHFAKEMDNQNHLMQREKGFYEWFSSYLPQREIKTFEINASGKKSSENQLESILSENWPAGILVTNSKVHLAASIMEKSGFKNIRLIGHDLLKENAFFLKKGIIDFLICQRPEEQGFNALDTLFKHVVQKSNVKSYNYTPIDIVINENIDYYNELK